MPYYHAAARLWELGGKTICICCMQAPSSHSLTSEYVEKTGLQEPLMFNGLSNNGSNIAYTDALARLVKPHSTNPGAFHLDRLPDLLDTTAPSGGASARAAAMGGGTSNATIAARREDKEVGMQQLDNMY
jgi:hypothetical protein